MKIIHTADIHLKEYNDVRWEALESIIKLGSKKSIDVLTIGGDLFDKNSVADKLKNNLRNLFSNIKFHVIFIPGNHDVNAISGDEYFGENFHIIDNYRNPFEINDYKIWGIPYCDNNSNEDLLNILDDIKNSSKKKDNNILLFHGELTDSFFSSEDYGDEEVKRYMPVKKEELKDLNFNYILAGHFHSSYKEYLLNKNSFFIYPGSPVSITKKEIGKRKVSFIEENAEPDFITIDSFYYEKLKFNFDPYSEDNPRKKVEKMLDNYNKNINLIIEIGGYINGEQYDITEKELVSFIREKLDDKKIKYSSEDMKLNFKDISSILESEIYKKFETFLNKEKYKKYDKNKIREIVIKAMSGLNYEN